MYDSVNIHRTCTPYMYNSVNNYPPNTTVPTC